MSATYQGIGLGEELLLRTPSVAIEAALTEDTRAELLRRVTEHNPHLRGAHVADVLSMAWDADLYLVVREPAWDRAGERLSDELADGMGEAFGEACIAAAIMAADPPECENPRELAEALDRHVDRVTAAAERLMRAAHAGELATVNLR